MLHDKYDIEYLKSLLRDGLPEDPATADTCGVVVGTRTKLPHCSRSAPSHPVLNLVLTRSQDVDHPQGKGKMLRLPCQVEFNIIIPTNLELYPFYLFTSHGVHSHPPPPPTKHPKVLAQELLYLIAQANDPSMTVGKSVLSSS